MASTDPIAARPTMAQRAAAALSARVMRHLGRAISLLVLIAVVYQIGRIDLARVLSILPMSPLFWIVFAANYLYGSVADWVIFHRVWKLPPSGIFPLLRKQIGNTLLLGYVGELYLYDWARKRRDLTGSPFAAVKDVAILSAVMGNVVTVAAVLLVWPLVAQTRLPVGNLVILSSIAFLCGSTAVILLLSRKLFSLPRPQLVFIAAVHLARIVVGLVLTGICWHLALPQVSLIWWVMLSVASMLLGRLPFVSNKDFVFAALAVFLIGHDAEIPALMTMMATLILATHLTLGLVLMATDVLVGDRSVPA